MQEQFGEDFEEGCADMFDNADTDGSGSLNATEAVNVHLHR